MHYTSKDVILAFATGMIALGGFPKTPVKIQQLLNNEMTQWALFYILVWQGGAKQDPKLAALVTAAVFALYRSLSD